MIPETNDCRSPRDIAAVVALAATLICFVVLSYWQTFPQDDGAFFLRYAQNLAAGHGYVWNPGIRDAIGASAPLWPLLIAVPILVGMEPLVALRFTSVLVSFVAFGALLYVAKVFWGRTALVPLVLALASSGWTLGCMMGGLETPLTVLLLALAMGLVAVPGERPLLIASSAALLFVQKLDLLPWAVGLLLGGGLWRLRARQIRALGLALLIVAVYFTGMWLLTGHWFPVSFLRKLHDATGNVSTMPWRWFLSSSLLQNRRFWLLVPALLSFVWLVAKRSKMAVLLGVGMGGQLLAYSLFPPTETFVWYTAPVQVGIAFLMSGVVNAAVPWMATRRIPGAAAISVLAMVLAALVVFWNEPARNWFVRNAATTEADRSRAGLWVAEHTPRHFRVATGYGNPAFFSNRFVYDSSGLNMTAEVNIGHRIANEKPEVLIECPFRTGVPPTAFRPPAGYVMVKYFDSARTDGFADFYSVVLVREELTSQLTR